jgi:hypothetical protein
VIFSIIKVMDELLPTEMFHIKKDSTLITEGDRILASLKVPRQSQVFLLAKAGSSRVINATVPPKCSPISFIKIPA